MSKDTTLPNSRYTIKNLLSLRKKSIHQTDAYVPHQSLSIWRKS